MKTSYIITIVVVVVIIAAGIAFWAYSPNSSYAPATVATSTATSAPMAPMTPATPSVVLNVMTSPTLGTYLVATNGMTLYTTAGTCTGSCAIAWPPYTVPAGAIAGGVNVSGIVGTTALAGGLQVTYKGMPLYFWSKDSKPGDTTGENVGGFTVAKP